MAHEPIRPAGQVPTRRTLLSAALPAATLPWVGSVAFAAPRAATPNGRPTGGAGGPVADMLRQAFDGDEYALPPLPYAYDALQPHIDAETMQLHHARHHQSYVDGLNRAIGGLADLRRGEADAPKLAGLQRDVTFNAGGHLLHAVFWGVMGPADAGRPDRPTGVFAEALDEQYGQFDTFKNHFSAVANGVKGSGWATLLFDPTSGNLLITQTNEHDAYLVPGGVPVLALDVWEHAYYLQYRNHRAEYVNAWWNTVHWSAVGAWYEAARSRTSL